MATERQFIINFHGIGEPHAGVEAAECPYWVSEDFFDAIVERVLARPDAERVLWTFDDGNRSDLTIGAARLARRGVGAAFFLLTGRFDDPRYLSRGGVRELLAMGMTVGLHGRDHVDWRSIGTTQLVDETDAARRELAEVAGANIDSVAIPFGAYNRKVIAHLKRQGFARIYTSDGGPSAPRQRVCSRTSVRTDMTLADIDLLIDDRGGAKKKLRRAVSSVLRRHVI